MTTRPSTNCPRQAQGRWLLRSKLFCVVYVGCNVVVIVPQPASHSSLYSRRPSKSVEPLFVFFIYTNISTRNKEINKKRSRLGDNMHQCILHRNLFFNLQLHKTKGRKKKLSNAERKKRMTTNRIEVQKGLNK